MDGFAGALAPVGRVPPWDDKSLFVSRAAWVRRGPRTLSQPFADG
jgi:hypothetical protein